MHIKRLLASTIRASLRQFPAVTILGSRQCGKTTLARRLGDRYFDLEQEAERTRLDIQWDQIGGDPSQTHPPPAQV
ncbi:MAG: hypothetical protein LBK99_20755, partial [Opitutaceae bacterium]|nr:hypothetical protein [Opitutaceae bacterium]